MGAGVAGVRPAEDALPATFEPEIRRLRFKDPKVERAFQDDYAKRRIPQFRVVFWVGLAIQAPLSLRFAFIEEIGPDDPRFWLRLAVGVIPAVAGLLLARSTRAVRWLPVYIVFYVLLIGVVLVSIFATSPIGWTSLTTYLIAACIMSRLTAREAALVEILLIGFFAFVSLVVLGKPLASLSGGVVSLGTLALFILVAVYLIEHSARRDFLLMRLLGQERERSERLLLNVLPAPVAQRLKESSGTVADSFSEVTVLFADITDSTPNIARMAAETVVELLNDVFSAFDRLADHHGLEKIKTIGDGYMVGGGLPEPRPDHAEAVVAMALDMQTEIARFRWPSGKPMALRVGINTGPVVAGVIGTRRFIYDLYGDTANVANRMESHGIAGAIQMTRATYERVRDRYSFTERTIDIRGKGTTATYLLVPELSRVPGGAPLPTET